MATSGCPGARSGEGTIQGEGRSTLNLIGDGPREGYNIPFVDNTFPASRSSIVVA
jgi:hypothetical protein